jgi:hypothetical protein
MISNQRPFATTRHGFDPRSGSKPPVQEDTIKTGQVQIERKTFVLTLKENPRGRFLRITEETGGRRNSIIIPAPGLGDFKRIFAAMEKASADMPLKAAQGLA